jgi:hypothetical protein
MFKMTIKAEDYNEILRLGKIVKPDRKNTHEELDNIAIYIKDSLIEGEAHFCDNYIYGKFVFQVQEIVDLTKFPKNRMFMLPRQTSEAAKPGTFVSLTWYEADETERHFTTEPVYVKIEATSKFGIQIAPEIGVPVGYWPAQRLEEDFEKPPAEDDLSYNVERLQRFASFFPKNQFCRLQFRHWGIFGKVSILNNEWYCYTLGARLSKRRA